MTVLEKQPSPELLSLIKGWTDSYIKTIDLPGKILEQAQKEGFTKAEIRTMIEGALVNRGLGERRIREIIPKELKEVSKMRSVRPKEANSGSLRQSSAAKPEQPEESDHDWQGEKEEEQMEKIEDDDVEFLKKRLAKYVDDSRLKEVIIENKDKEIEQLQEALKKTSFEPATEYRPPPTTFQWPEPDENNTFVFKEITFDEFRMKLGPLKAGGNTKINVYLERVK